MLDEPGIVKSFVPDRADWYSTDAFTDKGIQWLKEMKDDGEPFLLYMAYNAPHWPLHAPQENIDRCQGRYDAGYDAIRNARYERQVASGLFDPGITKLPRPSMTSLGMSSRRNGTVAASSKWKFMPPWSNDWTRTSVGWSTVLRKQGRLDNTLVLFPFRQRGQCGNTDSASEKLFSRCGRGRSRQL